MKTDYISASQEEKFNYSKKQQELLEKLNLNSDKRLAIFKSYNSMSLTKQGFVKLNEIEEFRRLKFDKPLTPNEVLKIRNFTKEAFFVHPKRYMLSVLDPKIISLYSLIEGKKDKFFYYFSID